MVGKKRNLFHGLLVVVSTLSFSQLLAETQTTSKLSYSYSNKSKRSLTCIPMIKHFEVELEHRLKSGEGVGLTGDHIKLGQWQVDKSLEMKFRRRNPQKWYLKIPMCSSHRIYYRFFIYHKDANGSKRIRKWEGQQHARVLEAYEMRRSQGSFKFGEAHATAIGGGVQKEKGWLRGEYIVQMKFIWPQHIRFTSFTHFIRNLKYNIKVESFATRDSQRSADIEIEVSRFTARQSYLKPQSDTGEFYKPGKILIFHITAPLGLKILHTLTIKSKEGEPLGRVSISETILRNSEGILILPIYDARDKHNNYRVGWLTLPYTMIEPLPNAEDLRFRTSFHHYWPYNWPTLDVAHRGMGKSFYYHSAKALENTIQSFLRAHQQHSDMVELDIHLTKDYVPIVWNDCGFYTVFHEENVSPHDLIYIYINDLTYDELLQRRVFVYMNGAMVELSHLNTAYVDEKERIFPRLVDVFEHLPLSLGIIMEVKWPQLLSSGSLEYLQSLDKNRYVDIILVITMRHSCGRPLIFSSFDADICTMIRFKQHVFPVLLLTVGQRSPWESYADLRTRSLTEAINFAQSADILGTAVYADEMRHSRNQIDLAFQQQQVLFIWGDQLNDSTTLKNFRELEVAGMIYDRVDDHLAPKQKRFAFFEAIELKRIFLRQCIAAGNDSLVEGALDKHSPFWPRVRSLEEL